MLLNLPYLRDPFLETEVYNPYICTRLLPHDSRWLGYRRPPSELLSRPNSLMLDSPSQSSSRHWSECRKSILLTLSLMFTPLFLCYMTFPFGKKNPQQTILCVKCKFTKHGKLVLYWSMVGELSYLHISSKSKVIFYWVSKNIYLQASLMYLKIFSKQLMSL